MSVVDLKFFREPKKEATVKESPKDIFKLVDETTTAVDKLCQTAATLIKSLSNKEVTEEYKNNYLLIGDKLNITKGQLDSLKETAADLSVNTEEVTFKNI